VAGLWCSCPHRTAAGPLFGQAYVSSKSFYGPGVKDFLIGRQYPQSWRALLLAALMIAPGCSNLAQPQDSMPTMGVDPAYSKLVAKYLTSKFTNLSPYEGAEISQPRWVQANIGWSWLACVHFQDLGRRRTYAVFFRQSEVVDARYAVQTDACGAQTYTPLDLSMGMLRPGAIGDTGPLY